MKFRSLLYVGISLVSLVASLPLTKHYGVIGCATTTALALFIGHVLIMNIYYHKKININMIAFWKEIIKMSIAPILFSTLCFFAIKQININQWTQWLISVCIFSILYCLIFWLTSMNRYEKDLVKGMIQKIKTRK
jgi:hypothetical protein